jgi:hypothetical protein
MEPVLTTFAVDEGYHLGLEVSFFGGFVYVEGVFYHTASLDVLELRNIYWFSLLLAKTWYEITMCGSSLKMITFFGVISLYERTAIDVLRFISSLNTPLYTKITQ